MLFLCYFFIEVVLIKLNKTIVHHIFPIVALVTKFNPELLTKQMNVGLKKKIIHNNKYFPDHSFILAILLSLSEQIFLMKDERNIRLMVHHWFPKRRYEFLLFDNFHGCHLSPGRKDQKQKV